MGYASKEALLEYTQEDKKVSRLGYLIGGICLIMGIIFMSTPIGVDFCLFFIAGGIYLLCTAGRDQAKYKKYLSAADSTGELQRMLTDFANSKSLADDRIRLGEEYIFGKRMGRPITYAELRKIYPYVTTKSRYARYLKGATPDGTEYILCAFDCETLKSDSHPDEPSIYQMITSRNPYIQVRSK